MPGVVDLVNELVPDPSWRVLNHGICVVDQSRGGHLLALHELRRDEGERGRCEGESLRRSTPGWVEVERERAKVGAHHGVPTESGITLALRPECE